MNALKIFFASVCLLAAFNAQTAHAQLVVYPSRVAFDAVYPTANVENFDEYPNNTILTNGVTWSSGITYNTNSSNNALVTNYLLTSTGENGLGEEGNTFFVPTDTITFTFQHPLTAFAIDINTDSFQADDYAAILNNGDTIFSSYDPFLGYSTGESIEFTDSDPFTSITILGASPDAQAYTLDTLQYDGPSQAQPSVVPEPSTIALMFVGLLGLAVIAFRRRIIS